MEIQPLTEQEIQQIRAETKGTKERVHFNNAGASLPPDVVVDTVINYLKEEAMFGGYETEFKYSKELANVYSSIAKLINADADEIALVENASIGWGLAFNGISFTKGDEIITTEMEYSTNLLSFINAEKTAGAKLIIIPNDEKGNFQLAAFEAAITPQTKLIAVTHIPSAAGGMIPIVEIGKIARKHNILYLLDACQTVGHAPIDVKEIGCDMLSVTGRKYLRAPRGTGFLFVKRELLDKLKLTFMDGHTVDWMTKDDYKVIAGTKRFEVYEKNRALILGLGKAVDYVLNIGMDRIWQRIQYLADLMRNQLSNIDNITVHDMGDQKCGIVTFSIKGIDSVTVKNKLAEKHINVSVSLPKTTLIYMEKNHLYSVVRASVHYYNTEEEIKQTSTILASLK
jgi:cysteine desulfurase/selenocysteine lyase